MKEKTTALLEKAADNLHFVNLKLAEGGIEIAASRVYYAMFYVAEAPLYEIGLSFNSHRAVIAAFGKHFAKKDILDSKYHRAIIAAFRLQNVSDYDLFTDISMQEVEDNLSLAAEFLEAAKNYLK